MTLAALLLACGCLGGPVAQSADCAAYVACVKALDAADGLATNLTRFEPGGACWGNAEISDLCTAGCARALERMRAPERVRARTLLPEECAP